ncbi:U2-type spliceosomal complex subunit CWC24 Ecym_1443 [Eremothecium cymbalariae DBVPG|uniref:Pre-mRNA-splicing factor CWC24 n=1 Tax=Eremothecium cymbalariae (strain CBS 270.75 / DBVPG 7215 / KCTC 17166 / NRRL Y-17582) TaxID=931890 RepID=G8JMF2_ERECY|nr:hypothetical protein Ecym_1443 [Eremothecium cymbalariae DBVPG\
MFKKRGIKGGNQKKLKIVNSLQEEDESEICTEVLVKKRKVIPSESIPDGKEDDKAAGTCNTAGNLNGWDDGGDANAVKKASQDTLTVMGHATREQAFDREMESETSVQKLRGSYVKPAVGRNIRTNILMDYQPDVCKDFKQTGYCGYGDSCKFLHSRDDFKAGWKLNQEWKVKDKEETELEKEVEDIPFKCIICEENYKSPVVTKCGHYFCSKCFMNRVKITPNCAICKEDTQGVVKMATKLQKLLDSQKKV